MNKYKSFSKEAHKKRKADKMCHSKKQFDSYEDAFLKKQRAYKCPICKKFHRSGSLTKLIVKLKK